MEQLLGFVLGPGLNRWMVMEVLYRLSKAPRYASVVTEKRHRLASSLTKLSFLPGGGMIT